MEPNASNPSMEKETRDVDDGSLNLKIKELRIKAEEVRQQKLKETREKYDFALKELFYLNNKSSTESYTELIPDIKKLEDSIQLQIYLQSHKLGEKNWEVDKSSTKLDNTTQVATSNIAEQSQPFQQINIQSQIQGDQTTQIKKKRASIPTERMVTRAVSGAINPKTVEEILKDAERGNGLLTSPTSATTPRIPVRLNMPPRKQSLQRTNMLISEGRHLSSASTGRIDANMSRSFDRETIIINFNNNPVYKSLQPPKKAITTSEWRVAIEEVKYARVIERIEELKRLGLWSRKQIEPFRDPPRYKTHWDYLLEEMIWMRTDFREERKQKIKTAYILALAIQDWHMAEDKSTVCVKRRIPEQRSLPSSPTYSSHESNKIDSTTIDILDEFKSESEDNTIGHSSQDNKWSLSTDDVMIDVESVDDDSSTRIGINQENMKDNDSIKMPPPIAPHVLQSLRQKVFNLPEDALICRLEGPDQQIYEVDSIFPDLPVYKPPEPSENDIYFDEIHCYKIMPISKCLWRKPPKEKSNKRRYESEDQQRFKKIKLESEEETSENQDEELTLFTSHAPFERQVQIRVTAPKKDQDSSTVWYPEDDEILMSLTKKYQYNWDLIADAWNSSRGLITGYERSPWECYVRWTQKDDMSQFIINHYNESVNEESTVEVLIDSSVNDALSLSLNTLNMRPKRDMPKNIQKRDITKPRRNSSLAEAMKKAAKKRADSNQKQLQNRRNHDQPTPIMHHVMTPIELSKMKSDQERQIQTALLEQRQAAVLAFQGHTRQPMIVRPQANPAMPYLTAQTRPPAGMAVTNQLQAFVQQQQQQRAAAMAQHRHHPQQLTQSIAQHAAHAQFYNAQFRHAQRNQLLQVQNPMVQQQIVQQHQAAARQQQAQIPQQTAQQTQNIQQTQENVVSQSQQST